LQLLCLHTCICRSQYLFCIPMHIFIYMFVILRVDLQNPIVDEKMVSSSSSASAVSKLATGGDVGDLVDDDDSARLGPAEPTMTMSESRRGGAVSPRWQTRVFAMHIVSKIMHCCESERAHLDLALAKELQFGSGKSESACLAVVSILTVHKLHICHF